ncbi:MAG: SufE family protein [Alphaproteobacteria bacterium]|nr:SufE family protein [Alphaproteobacteria bacterium]
MTRPIDDLISDFELLDDWEDRYRHLIELGRALPPMDDALKTPATRVLGCASQVWIFAQVDGDFLQLQGDSDALIVKGLIAIVLMLFAPMTRAEIIACDTTSVFAKLGLKDHLTPQRSNGLASMVARIKAHAAA